MVNVGIVGAGHSGLQLGFALLQDGDQVTIYSDKRPEDFAGTRLPSSNSVFSRGLDRERALGLNFWEGQKPLIDQTFVRIGDGQGGAAVAFDGRFARCGQAIDQRLKFATWLQEFESRGGNVVYGAVSADDLDDIAAAHDLAIIAAGKGDITRLFQVDEDRLTYHAPQRKILMVSVLDAVHPSPDGVLYNILPGVGEAFGIPMLMANGIAYTWVIEAIPGGPMDRFAEVSSRAEAFDAAMAAFRDFFPWEVERHANARIADANAWLTGGVPPLVRKPVLTLASGRQLMGLADVVVLNDPCTGQGANSASEAADIVYRGIRAREGQPFDAEWMERIFEEFWDYAQWPTMFTNALMGEWPEHAVQLLGAAGELEEIGHRFSGAFNDPRDLQHYFFDPESARLFTESAGARAKARASMNEQFATALA